jgi:hypothetical protein
MQHKTHILTWQEAKTFEHLREELTTPVKQQLQAPSTSTCAHYGSTDLAQAQDQTNQHTWD